MDKNEIIAALDKILEHEDNEYGEALNGLKCLIRRYDYLDLEENSNLFQLLCNLAEINIAAYVNEDIDPATGLPWGEHGTADNALYWILHVSPDGSDLVNMSDFLRGWELGDLTEWPEYYEWLKR